MNCMVMQHQSVMDFFVLERSKESPVAIEFLKMIKSMEDGDERKAKENCCKMMLAKVKPSHIFGKNLFYNE